MIQTQLLRLEPPYQIISAGGRVGIQVATLIVTEDKSENGNYAIETHSHPVVNYGLKQGLDEALKYNSYADPDEWGKVTSRFQPEGAVWNRVEVGDVYILGLAGREDKIGLRKFISLVPTERIDGAPTWNFRSITSMRSFGYELQKVGLSLYYNDDSELRTRDRKGNHVFYLEYIDFTDIPIVRVVLKDGEQSPIHDWDMPIHFYVQLFEVYGPTDDNGRYVGRIHCKSIIRSAMEMLGIFFNKERISFSYRRRTNHPYETAVAQLAKELNEAIK